MFKKLQNLEWILSLCDQIRSKGGWIVGWLGGSGITAFCAKAGGAVQFLGWPLTICLAGIFVGCFVLLLLIYNHIKGQRAGQSVETPDYQQGKDDLKKPYNKTWEALEFFAAWQAACLWAGEEPFLPIRHGTDPYPLLKLISTADENELPVHKKHEPNRAWPDFDPAWNDYKRTDLSAFARKKNLTPKFPF